VIVRRIVSLWALILVFTGAGASYGAAAHKIRIFSASKGIYVMMYKVQKTDEEWK
jgi:hypothetical protein